jgi:hypothetical protein
MKDNFERARKGKAVESCFIVMDELLARLCDEDFLS